MQRCFSIKRCTNKATKFMLNGAVKNGSDKISQNYSASTVYIINFYVENSVNFTMIVVIAKLEIKK